MTISATNWMGGTAVAATEQSSAREARSTSDPAAEEFAGMLASAVTATQKPEAEQPKDGVSDLDAPEPGDADQKTEDDKPWATTTIVTSTAALDPELQARLARVVARMREETGAQVKVTETFRTQARQDALFAQGRDTPGPIVTWTQNSKHTQGRAVDLVLEGSTNTNAYEALQRIAHEEGLRTLGAKDPGHLELPGNALNAEPVQTAHTTVARVAEVAKVAQVAEVARPADVARLATTSTTVEATHVQVAARPVIGERAGSNAGSGERDGSRGDHRGGYGAMAAAVALREGTFAHHGIQEIGQTVGSTAAERAARIMAAYEDAPARPLSQITMSVDAGNGAVDRVHVALRGSAVSAAIDAGDLRGAEAMNSRADELVRALSKDGLSVESLHVRAAAATTAAASSQAQSGSSDSSNHSRPDRGSTWEHRQQDRQRSNDDRREQQRQRRGGFDQ